MPYIAIDTNIFIHLLNPAVNHNSHIDKLLVHLLQLECQLLVDSTKKIGNEYIKMIIPIIKNMDETKPQLPILRLWMDINIRYQVMLDPLDNLMKHIKSVIDEKDEHADRAFVYVVCAADSLLVTNDRVHILDRREALLKSTAKSRGRNTDIQSSLDAFAYFGGNV
jgi:hypothetical protein